MATQGVIQLQLAGEALSLLPQRAIHWPDRRTLILADPHIGKDDTFRRAGIPVPCAVAEADFARLNALVTDHRPERLVILGDLLHARLADRDHCLALLRGWRDTYTGEVLLVRGNHDLHAGNPPADLGFRVVDEPYRDGPFEYRHFPLPNQSPAQDEKARPPVHVFAGHLHPGVTVRLDRLQARRVPCFHVTRNQTVLPAFGAFTGTARIDPNSVGDLYAVGSDRVIKLPRPVLA
ncbi:MAG: ligase-associated DNA damage response endonuclease PdeM [Planctomycetota bacterium]